MTRIYLLIITLVLIWGLGWPVNKIGLHYISAIWFAALRLIIATLTMFMVVGLIGQLRLPTRQDIPVILVLGVFQITLFITFSLLGLFYVEAGRSAILSYTTPLWVMPIAILFFNEKLTILKLLGFVLGMAGIVVLFSPWSFDWKNVDALWGNLILLCGALSLAIAMVCARNMRWHSSPVVLLPWQLLVGTLPVLLFACYHEPHPQIVWNSVSVTTLIFTAVFATGFANWIAVVISKELPSITVSLSLLAVPLLGIIFSALILGESITFSITIAMLLIPAGIACVSLGNHK